MFSSSVTEGPIKRQALQSSFSPTRSVGAEGTLLPSTLLLIATPPLKAGSEKSSGHEPSVSGICVGVAQSLSLWAGPSS